MVEVKYFKYSQDVFKLFGLWGTEGKTQTFKTRFIRYLMVGLAGSIIPIISLSGTIASIEEGDIALAFTNALGGFSYVLCFHKFAAAAFNNDEIFSCISQLEMMSHKFQNLKDINGCLKTYKMMATIGAIAINFCSAFFLLAPIVAGEFPYKPRLPYMDFTKSPYYEMMFIFQTAAVITLSNAMLAYDTLFCGLTCLCAGILASISRETSEININPYDGRSAENSLRKIIEKLIEISGLINRMSDLFSLTTMTSILYNCSLMALGLLMVSLLPLSDLSCITMMGVIIAETFQLWIYCYFGQAIVNEKEILQNKLYCTEWYNGSKSFKSMLLLSIFEAQTERYVMAGKMLPLSLPTFTDVMKRAYVFYTFMSETH